MLCKNKPQTPSPMATYDVVALGELLIDFAECGQSRNGNQLIEVCPGGAPSNVLAMLNKCGRKTAFIGKVGEDQFGIMLRKTLERVGIDTTGLVMEKEVPTTLAFVHTMEDGDRAFSFYRNPGADMMLRKEELNTDLIQSSRIFHFGTLSLTDEPAKSATIDAVLTAKSSNCLISFDPNYRPMLWKKREDAIDAIEYGLRQCDILKISDNEVLLVSGLDDYDEAVHFIIEKYQIPLIFLTMGKSGSRAYYKGMRIAAGSVPVNAIETTGAGDTFCGCVLHKVLEYGINDLNEERLKEILIFANTAAAIVTTRKGALLSMPEMEEVLGVIKRENR